MEGHSVEEYRRVLASQLEEFDKLTQMVNQLLVLARAPKRKRDPLDRSKCGSFRAGRFARRTNGTDRRSKERSFGSANRHRGIIVRGDSATEAERVILQPAG